jgi:hypothetical protein
MVITFRTNGKVFLPFLQKDHLTAMAAFVPEIVGCRFLARNERNNLTDTTDPVHAALSFAVLLMAALSDAT